MAETFSSKSDRSKELDDVQLKDLYAKIGQLTVERAFWLKPSGVEPRSKEITGRTQSGRGFEYCSSM